MYQSRSVVEAQRSHRAGGLTGADAMRWLLRARALVGASAGLLDRLDAFPVADSDTGSNLARTVGAACEAAERLPADTGAGDVLAAAARGALLRASGRSGTILAQFLRGLADAAGRHEVLDPPTVVWGLNRGEAEARTAVLNPADASMLSVLRAAVDAADFTVQTSPDLFRVMAAVEAAAEGSLETTARSSHTDPRGVDAGGLGILLVLSALASVMMVRPSPDPYRAIARWRPVSPVPTTAPAVLSWAPGSGLDALYRARGWLTWSRRDEAGVAAALRGSLENLHPAGTLFVLPNDKAVAKTALAQARVLGDLRVEVLPSFGHAQGAAAALQATSSEDTAILRARLEDAIAATSHDELHLEGLDLINLPQIVRDRARQLVARRSAPATVATVIVGRDCPRPVGRLLQAQLLQEFPHVELVDGGQPTPLVVLALT